MKMKTKRVQSAIEDISHRLDSAETSLSLSLSLSGKCLPRSGEERAGLLLAVMAEKSRYRPDLPPPPPNDNDDDSNNDDDDGAVVLTVPLSV